MGREISVSCIHGVTRNYPTAEISMVTPRGQFRVYTGVVECLPIPVLVGRDCQAFATYWRDRAAEGKIPPRHQRRHSFRHQPTPTKCLLMQKQLAQRSIEGTKYIPTPPPLPPKTSEEHRCTKTYNHTKYSLNFPQQRSSREKGWDGSALPSCKILF